MQEEDYQRLKNGIDVNDYDARNPIWFYEGAILDGWNRERACKELGIEPVYDEFIGTDMEAIGFVMRTNNRRDLTSSQRACIAVEAEDIVNVLKKEAKERMSEGGKGKQLIATLPTDAKVAEIFNTNRTYYNDARKLRPEVFKDVKAGIKTITEAKREERQQEKQERQQRASDINDLVKQNIVDIARGWHKIGNQFLYYGNNFDDEFISNLPYCKFGFADPPYNAGVAKWDSNFKWIQDSFIDKCDVFAVTPGGWESFNFYKQTDMPYVWELICYITNGMTHGRCGFANYIKASIFSKSKVKIPQDLFTITIKVNTTEDTNHKGRKPYEFITELINLFSKEGDCIFDIFAGSGTTLLMAEKFNRVSYNAEIEKQFCIEIINRGIENNMKYERL